MELTAQAAYLFSAFSLGGFSEPDFFFEPFFQSLQLLTRPVRLSYNANVLHHVMAQQNVKQDAHSKLIQYYKKH